MLSRVRAFLIHLAASAALALLVVLLVFGIWYPAPLDKAVGVSEVFFILLVVDVAIGPVLTLFVYKAGKRTLRFDLTAIVCVQLAAFAYGLWTVAEGRPAWLIFNVDRFDLVQVYEIDRRRCEAALPEFRQPSFTGPGWGYARRGETPEERKMLLAEAVAGIFVTQKPELYLPLSVAQDQIRENAKPLLDLKKFNESTKVDTVLSKWPEADAFLPMMARSQPVTVLIDKTSAKVVAIVDLNPWQ